MFHIVIRPYEHYLWSSWGNVLHSLALHVKLFSMIDPLVGREGYLLLSHYSTWVCPQHPLLLSLLRLVVFIVGFCKKLVRWFQISMSKDRVSYVWLEEYAMFPFGQIRNLEPLNPNQVPMWYNFFSLPWLERFNYSGHSLY